MKAKFFVIDGEGMVSYSAKTEGPESFGSYAAAVKRAKELAEDDPGAEIIICEAMAFVCATVQTPIIKKLRP